MVSTDVSSVLCLLYTNFDHDNNDTSENKQAKRMSKEDENNTALLQTDNFVRCLNIQQTTFSAGEL